MRCIQLNEVAKMLCVSVPILRREIDRDKLAARKIGGRIYVLEPDLKAYMDRCSLSSEGVDYTIGDVEG